ncbi:MAG: hypothetical protein ACFE0Q_10980 [Anaerolineae bacterium]
MDVTTIERRRLDLLERLIDEAHPLAIFYDLDIIDNIIFTLSDSVRATLQHAIQQGARRTRESSALATVKVAALTPDKKQGVYQVTDFVFETIGTTDHVLSAERERLGAGEIEVHTHLPQTPDYLGYTDVGDLIAAVEGPAWVHPTTNTMIPALRIYSILSIYNAHLAYLHFYNHDLRDALDADNNYGLKRLGQPVIISDKT